jgi:hypothetical protein
MFRGPFDNHGRLVRKSSFEELYFRNDKKRVEARSLLHSNFEDNSRESATSINY